MSDPGKTTDLGKLNDRQQAFVHWYIKLPNATWAARKAGYSGNDRTLGVMGHDLLKNPKIRRAIDNLLDTHLPSPKDTMGLIATRATFDLTDYLAEDGTLDVQALSAAGLGHLVKGVKPGREGLEITLVDPQAATKNLARYHRLLSDHLDVDVKGSTSLDAGQMASLAEQLAALQQSTAEQDDTEDSSA